MSKILVTGATGFVGTHLTKALAKAQHSIIAVDSSMGSIEQSDTWNNFPKAEVVIHLAAKTFVPDSWKQPDLFFQVNVNGTLNALEYCRKHHAKLIFLSSYLYGNPARLPIKEDDPIFTPNPYAFSKKTAEDLCSFYATAYNVSSIIFRPFNIFGSGQSDSFLIPMLIDQVLIHQKIQVKDLEPKRDYIYVDDIVSAIIHSINISSSHIIHLGSGISYSVKDIIDEIQSICGTNFPVASTEEVRKAEIMDTVADISKARKILGWQPSITLREGLKQMIEEKKRIF